MSWQEWAIIVLVVALVGHRFVPPHWWYIRPAKRRAMQLAVQAARLQGAEIVWAHCFIRRCDRDKCFVFLQHKCIGRPEPFSAFAVRFRNGRVDDLGLWQFLWGLFFPSQPMDAYEECQVAGVAWPVGAVEWMHWASARGRR